MKRLLLVQPDGGLGPALEPALRSRWDVLELEAVQTLERARQEVVRGTFAAVVIAPGFKRLSLGSFAKLAAERAPSTALLLVGEPLEGYRSIEGTDARRLLDEVLAVLGLARSVFHDLEEVEDLSVSGAIDFSRVRWPGAPTPLVRTATVPTPEVQGVSLDRAKRAGLVSGTGLARTLEMFWDDPRPHVLEEVPEGISLLRVLRQRQGWGAPVGLAIARGVVEGIATLHEAGFSCGPLEGPSTWLCADGEVLQLGHALLQLPYRYSEYFGLPEEAPPEEYGQRIDPQPQGDAFRLGLLVLRVAFDLRPFAGLGPTAYLAREWRLELGGAERQLSPRELRLIELLLAPWDAERPRGALLRQLVDEAAPLDWRGVIRDVVAWSRSAPPPRW